MRGDGDDTASRMITLTVVDADGYTPGNPSSVTFTVNDGEDED